MIRNIVFFFFFGATNTEHYIRTSNSGLYMMDIQYGYGRTRLGLCYDWWNKHNRGDFMEKPVLKAYMQESIMNNRDKLIKRTIALLERLEHGLPDGPEFRSYSCPECVMSEPYHADGCEFKAVLDGLRMSQMRELKADVTEADREDFMKRMKESADKLFE